MNALEDRRPVAATTTASDNPSVIGEDLGYLLAEHPDIELASIRLIPNDDGTVGIAGRIGPLTPAECPSCHTTAGHPHTDYCQHADTRHLVSQHLGGTKPPGQWLHYEGNPSRTDHRAAGGTWHPAATCTRVYCGATPDDGVWPGQDTSRLDVTVHSHPVQVPLDDPAVVDDIFSDGPDSP